MRVPHPIPYQGSKRSLARSIVACFPARIDRLIEPFAGSAAVTLAAAQRNAARCFVLNDTNAPLIQLWREIVEQPQDLARHYRQLWIEQQGRERDYYEAVRAAFNQTHAAHYLLYLLARCVKAAVRYNASGAFNQSPDHRRKGTHPQRMEQQILGASRLLEHRVTLSALDYREVLPLATTRDLVYLDPPYQGVCGQRDPRYIQGVTFDALVDLLYDLNDREIAYIVSYDGRTGGKAFGRPLPADLELNQLEIDAGRSSQATLLGRTSRTVESLYLSAPLCRNIDLQHIMINHGFASLSGAFGSIRG